jgi:hypothetical protein
MSKTHIASGRIAGSTADYFARNNILKGTSKAEYIWIDEVSQLDIGLLCAFNHLSFTGVKFLLSGDFNQFGPVSNLFRGVRIDESRFEHSRLLWRMADGNRITLTQCRRSDSLLFDFYSSLIPGGSRFHIPLRDVVHMAQTAMNFSGTCPHNLCISHEKRVEINSRLNLAERPPDAVEIRVHREKSANSPQTMWIWAGLKLIGAKTRDPIHNSVLYTISVVGDDSVQFEGLEKTFTFKQTAEWFRLSYCTTYASCQGTEYDDALRLWETSHPYFTMKHLFVALSRAKDISKVSVRA